MPKEEGPLEYQRRIRDTKSAAQRLDLNYLKRPAFLILLRRRITWIAVAAALLACIPVVLGIAGGKKAILPGPLSPAHAMFQERCEVCHSQSFSTVPDAACKTCHDGSAHPAKSIDTAHLDAAPRCSECHVEHRGSPSLSSVANGNCTRCHSDLKSRARGVHLAAVNISTFRPGKHPEFPAISRPDLRPIRLNHAIHMPSKPTAIRNMKLPMQCTDCHRMDPASPTGDPVAVTFEQSCRSCHARELEFDVYGVLPTPAAAPHTKDPQTTHQFILDTYRQALAADPAIVRKPVGNETAPQPSAAAWLDRVVRDSESFLFQRKCNYCHEYAGMNGSFPVVAKVNRIRGRYAADKPEGEPWLQRGEFSHRAHRAVECESCHVSARASARTGDVLIPSIHSCLPCHQESEAGLDRCSTCHLYHNRDLERDNRRSTQVIRGGVQ
jgi:hypothetical protein